VKDELKRRLMIPKQAKKWKKKREDGAGVMMGKGEIGNGRRKEDARAGMGLCQHALGCSGQKLKQGTLG
jgi:hypothetical protein